MKKFHTFRNQSSYFLDVLESLNYHKDDVLNLWNTWIEKKEVVYLEEFKEFDVVLKERLEKFLEELELSYD